MSVQERVMPGPWPGQEYRPDTPRNANADSQQRQQARIPNSTIPLARGNLEKPNPRGCKRAPRVSSFDVVRASTRQTATSFPSFLRETIRQSGPENNSIPTFARSSGIRRASLEARTGYPTELVPAKIPTGYVPDRMVHRGRARRRRRSQTTAAGGRARRGPAGTSEERPAIDRRAAPDESATREGGPIEGADGRTMAIPEPRCGAARGGAGDGARMGLQMGLFTPIYYRCLYVLGGILSGGGTNDG